MASPFDPDSSLTDDQLDLLAIILRPFSDHFRGADWPIWGWVQRQFEEQHPRQSAASTLTSMPTALPTYAGSKPYGLVWRSDWNTPEPMQEEAVGLTIMGLMYLGSRERSSRRAADALVKILRDLAVAESRIVVTPTSVGGEEASLDNFAGDFRLMKSERPFTFTTHAIGRVLQREYDTPLTLVPASEGWRVRLQSNRLRRYLELENAAEYAAFINQSDLESRFKPEAMEFVGGTVLPPEHHPTAGRSADYDADLWEFVRKSVEAEDWDKVASQVATFVEDRVRRWSGVERGLVGHGLYTKVLKEGGVLALGGQRGEEQGWYFLGAGLAQAIGNVDRHHVEGRSHARLYALGVLGLGSLLLTQIRFEHPDRAEPQAD